MVIILWEESFKDKNLSEFSTSAIVNIWTAEGIQNILPHALKAGHQAVLSFGAYLDRQNPVGDASKPAQGTHWMFMSTWTDMYSEMMKGIDGNAILGGEASSWGENVDQFNLDERIFHRLPAVAERLWSPDTVSDVNDARIRMAELRCKLLRRIAVRAGPVFPDYCDAEL